MHHAYDRSYNDAGWVFLDYRNNAKSLNDNAIIYGHRRLDTTVFGSLKNVLTSKWQNNKDNYVIYISTLKENMVFQIFSIYTIPKESYYITTDFKDKSEKEKWVDDMNKRNQAPTNTTATADDYILTLSTCQNHTHRIVVQAKLIKRQVKE